MSKYQGHTKEFVQRKLEELISQFNYIKEHGAETPLVHSCTHSEEKLNQMKVKQLCAIEKRAEIILKDFPVELARFYAETHKN